MLDDLAFLIEPVDVIDVSQSHQMAADEFHSLLDRLLAAGVPVADVIAALHERVAVIERVAETFLEGLPNRIFEGENT